MKVLIIALALAIAPVFGEAHAAESVTTIWLGPNSDINEAAMMIERGKLSEGMARTRRAMKERDLHPFDAAAGFNNLCVGHLGLKLFEAAIKDCDRALSLRPSMWQAFNNRGNAYLGMAQYEEAIENYHKAMQLRPDLELIEFNLFLALNAKQRGIPAAGRQAEG